MIFDHIVINVIPFDVYYHNGSQINFTSNSYSFYKENRRVQFFTSIFASTGPCVYNLLTSNLDCANPNCTRKHQIALGTFLPKRQSLPCAFCFEMFCPLKHKTCSNIYFWQLTTANSYKLQQICSPLHFWC